jgi:hypothetical protein
MKSRGVKKWKPAGFSVRITALATCALLLGGCAARPAERAEAKPMQPAQRAFCVVSTVDDLRLVDASGIRHCHDSRLTIAAATARKRPVLCRLRAGKNANG